MRLRRFVISWACFGVGLFYCTAQARTCQELLTSADSLNRVAQYDSALAHANRALEIAEREFGKEDSCTARILRTIGLAYFSLGNYSAAEPAWRRALAIREKVLDPNDLLVAQSLNNLANIDNFLARYSEAEPLYKRALAIREHELGPEHVDVAWSLNNLAVFYFNLGRYLEAEPLYKRALSIMEKAGGLENPDAAQLLNNLANVYTMLRRFGDAEPLLSRALAIEEKTLGQENRITAMTLANLANVYVDQGRYSEAEPVCRRALAIRERILSPNHPDIAVSLLNLANLCAQQARYVEAEPLYRRAITIQEQVLGPDHPDLAQILNNLAAMLVDEGRFTDAETLYQRALSIRQNTFGANHPDVAMSQLNLGNLAARQGRRTDAETYYQQAIAIGEHAFGPENQRIAQSLNNLAALYTEEGRFAEAEPLYNRALRLREQAENPNQRDIAESLLNLANFYRLQNQPDDAEPLYRRMLAIWHAILGPEHPFYALGLCAYAMLAQQQGNFAAAREREAQAWEIQRNNFHNGSTVLAERNALEYSQVLAQETNSYLSILLDSGDEVYTNTPEIARIVLAAKGLVLDGILQRRLATAADSNPAVNAVVDSLKSARFALAKLYAEGPDEKTLDRFRVTLKAAVGEKERLEATLARYSANFRREQGLWDVQLQNVAAALPEASVLVEFMQYRQRKSLFEEEPQYLAVVLKAGQPPAVFRLGLSAKIDTAVMYYRRQFKDPQALDANAYAAAADNLYSLVWRPFAALLTGASTVFIAPDGDLNLVSFAGLRNDDGRYLIEEYPLHYLSTGRDLIRLQNPPAAGSGLLAMGDPDFNLSFAPEEAPIDTSAVPEGVGILLAYMNPRSSCEELSKLDVPTLPATRQEMNAVMAQWNQVQTEPVGYYAGKEATEEIFKQQAGGKRVLHLATHGFYLSDACQTRRGDRISQMEVAIGENPLLQCGFLLAGANQRAKEARDTDSEDGIVTAEEVSALDLHTVELAVLSACETGLGEVRSGEGVYGLRRAFQMAGTRTVISALWQVNDRSTAELMSQLFGASAASLPQAMQQAALVTIRKARSEGRSDHPFYWAAFVATGDWQTR